MPEPLDPKLPSTSNAPQAANAVAPVEADPNDTFDIEETQDSPEEASSQVLAPAEDAQTPPPPASKPKHSRHLASAALDLGISQADIDEASPEQLEYAVAQLVRRGRPQAPQAPAPQAEQPLVIPDEDQFHPEIAKGIRKAHELERKLARMEAERDQERQTSQQREQQRAIKSLHDEADAAFAKHERHFGKGDQFSVGKDSQEMARRRAVLTLVDSWGVKPGALGAQIDKAVGILFGQEPETKEPADDRAAEWREAGLRRPTARRNAAEPSGRAKAIRAVAEQIAAERAAEHTDDDLNGFPD